VCEEDERFDKDSEICTAAGAKGFRGELIGLLDRPSSRACVLLFFFADD
jgi:hypothetical protein